MADEGLMEEEQAPTPEVSGDQEVINQVKQAYPAMLSIMSDDTVLEGLINDAQGGDPSQVLAVVVAEMVNMVKQQVPNLAPEVLAAIGMLAIQELADLFNQIGIEVTPEMLTQAAETAPQIFMSVTDDATKEQSRAVVEQYANSIPGQEGLL